MKSALKLHIFLSAAKRRATAMFSPKVGKMLETEVHMEKGKLYRVLYGSIGKAWQLHRHGCGFDSRDHLYVKCFC